MKAAWLLLAALLLAAGSARAGDEAVGQIVALQGQAHAMGADGVRRPLEVKSPLFRNDRITTEAGARLQIQFVDNSTLSQGEKSEMVIDEYVYAPAERAGSGARLSVTKGLFRVVTDKITKLNPERFRVRTRMATIGIRGCDLGFNIDTNREDVFVIALHGAERVRIEPLPGVTGEAAGGAVEIAQGGTQAVLVRGHAVDVRTVSGDTLSGFLRSVEPGSAAGGPSAGDGSLLAALGSPAGGDGSAGASLPLLALPDPPPTTRPPDPPPPKDDVTPPEPPADNPPEEDDDEPQPPPPPPPPSRIFVPRGAGEDWSWGVWERAAVIEEVVFQGDQLISAPAFQALAMGTHLYTLSGSGAAAAVIAHGGSTAFVEGTCALNVQVGASVAPNWDGEFRMANPAGDVLNFDAEGTLNSVGVLSGNQSAYSLTVHGATFGRGTLTGEAIEGLLVGPGTGLRPITGAAGTFSFTHGSDASAAGGFGADVSE